MNMNKRDFFKAGTLFLALLTTSLTNGCKDVKNSNDKISIQQEEFNIEPKQTGVYEFSVPLPYDFNSIDKILNYNKTLKKSKITSFYNSIPYPCALDLNDFQSSRGVNLNIKSFDDFIKYVKYIKNKGYNFVYTLNSPKALFDTDFKSKSKALEKLFDNLSKANCKKIKVANAQLLDFLTKTRPDFELSASTSFEFNTLKQYVNLAERYTNLKAINLALDINRNFKLLQSLKKELPHIKFELMANEGCMYGCPERITHPCTGVNECSMINVIRKSKFLLFCQARNIYPWDLEYYSAMGINNFKLMKGSRANFQKIDFLTYYLDFVENRKNDDVISVFFKKIAYGDKILEIKDKNIMLSQVKKYLPDIKYFIKNGHKCAQDCAVNCKYCYECAKKISDILS